MNIALIRTSASPISPAYYNVQEIGLGKALFARGHSVNIVLAAESKAAAVDIILEDAVHCLTVHYLPVRRIVAQNGYFPHLLALLATQRPDVVVVAEYDNVTSWLVARWCSRTGTPVVLVQGMYRDYNGTVARVLQSAYDVCLLGTLRTSFDRVICKTTLAKNYLAGKGFNVNAVCPIGLDPPPVQAKLRRSRDAIGPKVVLYVGILEPRRNPLFLLRVFKRLLDSEKDLALWIVGVGPLLDACKRLVAEWDLASSVRFLGRVEQQALAAIYSRAYLSVLPSSYEIFGMVLLESMYHGVPVVSSRNGGSLDVIANNSDGVIVTDLAEDAWANAMESLIENPEFRDELSIRAREKVTHRYLWVSAVDAFIAEFDAALANS